MSEWKKTWCNLCAVTCGLEMEVEDNRIINVRPDPSSPRSNGYCCRKGRSAKYFVENRDRLQREILCGEPRPAGVPDEARGRPL